MNEQRGEERSSRTETGLGKSVNVTERMDTDNARQSVQRRQNITHKTNGCVPFVLVCKQIFSSRQCEREREREREYSDKGLLHKASITVK